MNRGDLIFMDDKLVAKAARSVAIPGGMEWRFPIPSGMSDTDFFASPDPDKLALPTGSLRRIFNLGGVQHWSLSIYGKIEPFAWMRSGWFDPYDGKPSSSASGMITALDFVLAELGDSSSNDYFGHRLNSMREYFVSRAAHEAKA